MGKTIPMAKTLGTTKSAKLVTASANDLHIAPRKMRLVTNLVKGMNAADAIIQLQHTEKKASGMLIKLIQSAIANAKNNFSLEPDHLYIKALTCDMGKVMKRYFPRARGSAFVIRRKMSHVDIILEERKKAKASKTRLGFLTRQKPEELSANANVDQQEAVAKKEKEETKKPRLFKTDEQVKMNKVQNKRRLFNRKSGE